MSGGRFRGRSLRRWLSPLRQPGERHQTAEQVQRRLAVEQRDDTEQMTGSKRADA